MPRFDRIEFMRGYENRKYGIFNSQTNQFINIVEKSPMMAKARLVYLVGDKNARCKRYSIRVIPENLVEELQAHTTKKTGPKYGIWNDVRKEYQFGIAEDSTGLALAHLIQKIGDNARKYRFSARRIPDEMVEIVKNSHHRKR